ncbi:MAG: glycoside hydrolase family 44 protein [Acidobacteria bacterium]|nr:glycoside hydrolase family 44 protein [Acidobacteriota bacterium]
MSYLRRLALGSRIALLVALAGAAVPLAAQELPIYDDQLRNGFQDWGWGTYDLAWTAETHSAPNAIRLEPDSWEALYLHRDASFDFADYLELRLWVRSEAGAPAVRLVLLSAGAEVASAPLSGFVPGGISSSQWREAVVDLAALAPSSASFNEIWFQDSTGGDQPALLLDDLRLVEDPTPPATVSVAVDPALDRRPISAFVFGVNFASPQQLASVGYTLNRWGGNRTTRYNWQLDVDSSAADWFFTNYTASEPAPPLPAGSAADAFVLDSRAEGAEVLLTLPTLGRVAGPDRQRRWSFSELTYGPQTSDECRFFGPDPSDWPPWCNHDQGNGLCDPAVNTTGFCSPQGEIVGNDPDETSVAVAPSFLADWASFVVSRAGAAERGGVRFYALDNEPMLWDSTHRDLHPAPPTYDEVWTRGRDVALAVKAVDPGARLLGPDTWGWCDLWTSSADAPGDCTDGPDRQAHGGVPFVEWYLQQVCAVQQQSGVRPVDYVDVHFYPQANGVAGTDDVVNEGVAATRLRSLRELWDPSYVSESWIGAAPRLIPRLREWVDAACPGVGIALTEYKWGADASPSGGLAQAELLAILAREGVDLATRWVVPATGSKAEEAFRFWLGYDGAGGKVQGESVRATTSDVDAVGAYAVRSPRDELFVLLFNKDDEARDVEVSLAAPVVSPAALWRFSASSALASAGALPVSGGALATTLPARSATLARLALVSDLVFRDDYESGSTWSWSATSQ